MLKGYDKSIKAEGQVYYSPYKGKIVNNINYSDIFSELIQAAGMGCEYYASDLFYNLVTISEYVENNKSGIFYIGIRSMGVDGNNFIKSRLTKGGCNYEPNCYIKPYRLEIENMETIREIINKYANKPIGEKRRGNLYDEIHALIPKEVMYIFSISIKHGTFGGMEIYLNYKNNRHWVWIIDSKEDNTYSELTEEKVSDIINNAKGKIVNDIDKYIADTYEKIAVLNGKIEEVEKLYSEVRDAADEMNIWSYDTTVKKYRI